LGFCRQQQQHAAAKIRRLIREVTFTRGISDERHALHEHELAAMGAVAAPLDEMLHQLQILRLERRICGTAGDTSSSSGTRADGQIVAKGCFPRILHCVHSPFVARVQTLVEHLKIRALWL
jgi:hypothetical protein